MEIDIEVNGAIEEREVIELYRLNNWYSAEKAEPM